MDMNECFGGEPIQTNYKGCFFEVYTFNYPSIVSNDYELMMDTILAKLHLLNFYRIIFYGIIIILTDAWL